eukprot:CAMPEP_0181213316 /NCGR_PEP_ID=MMETSP1096-20121128/24834_1 /TAXON_ID=156174 ORGANISM="Chrysochromulina ericina, Strain CCMP281" /NCGR_SAMPLE_ID=MMETSP1096 /ASSEMBLY_ACC=CAM_ASM_000453 /LENGTH=121 /DNA_ID=CAMNT_0023304935 /DNA_START=574 /DNA_END=936 /DNA_ORIENTATION=+
MIAWPRAMVRLVEFSFILAARLAFARHEEQHRQQRAQQGTLDDRGEVQAGMRVIARAKAHQLLQYATGPSENPGVWVLSKPTGGEPAESALKACSGCLRCTRHPHMDTAPARGSRKKLGLG